MANFKPQITIITEETRRNSVNSYGKENPYKTIQYKTYRELKKNLKKHLQENIENVVCVSRSKRGEWGEFYENWKLIDNKPTIIKSGWQ